MSDDRWLVHRHFAEQNNQRLDFVTAEPKQILLFGADGDCSRKLLAERYPKAAFAEYDGRADFLAAAAEARGTGWLAKLAGKTVPQTCQAADAPLPEASADMLWANLGLIQADAPLPVFEQWGKALKTDGLLFFTHFGRDSLAELLGRLKNEAGIECEAPMFFDMHDLGDMLPDSGFYDPVMDTAKLQLDYRSAETFWQDMETLGVWQSLRFADKAAEAAARAALNRWVSDGLSVTLETVYGHAVKKNVLPAGESPVQFYPRRPSEKKA
ncbi:MAG: methyltransferase [Neisseria sp.]|nr:methyltransferase [Neisseria sp.]